MASQIIDHPQISARERQVIELAKAALRLASNERRTYLDAVCTYEALRLDVEAAIAQRESANQLKGAKVLTGPRGMLNDAKTLSMAVEEQERLHDDSAIGSYHILRQISEGGMGVVYLADRNDAEFKQQVAIKLVRGGMNSEFVLSRFRDERQILASLNHPNIARLLDGGTTRNGRPYLVMEYIEGKPIMEYADEQRLSTVERLRLFQVVCSAVHYAHQNLIIHRDIKPSNILVVDDGTPKLLDFGIAKLLNPEIAGHALKATDVGIRLMTPEYASPEQVKGETITTASDVYSLGVLLYELLTGHQPYRISHGTPEEIARVVCEEEPPKPSVFVGRVEVFSPSDSDAEVVLTPEVVSRTREGNADKLRRRLAGDLDNIVLMAMRKDPARRYASVDQLASDIDRHLEGRPVTARKDTLAYRASKFVKRHKAGVFAALFILISLIAGSVTTLQQRARAERQSNEVRQLVSSFLLFNDAIKDLPGATPRREQLAKYALEKLDNLAREAMADKQLQRELAMAYQQVGDVQGNPYENNLGDRVGALASYQKALAIRKHLDQQSPSDVEERRSLAVIHLRVGQVSFAMGRTQAASEALQTGVGILQGLSENNQLDLPTSRALPNAYRTLAYALSRRGDPIAAMDSVRKGQALFEKLVAAHPNSAEARYDLNVINRTVGEALIDSGNIAGGLELLRTVLQIDKEFAVANPNNFAYKSNLATDYWKIGNGELLVPNVKSAVENFRNMLAITKEVADADRVNRKAQNLHAIAQVRLGRALGILGEYEEGLTYSQNAAAFFRKIAEDEPSSPYAQIQMAHTEMQVSLALAKTGKDEQALKLGDQARTVAEKQTAADPASVELRGLQAGIYLTLGDVHATLAARKRQIGEQAARWQGARDWYQRSYDLLKELKDQGQSTDPEYGTTEALEAKIRQCEASLAKLPVNALNQSKNPLQ